MGETRLLHQEAGGNAAEQVRATVQELREVSRVYGDGDHGRWLRGLADRLDAAIEGYVDDVLRTVAQQATGRPALLKSQKEPLCYVIRNEKTGAYKIGHAIAPDSRRWHIEKESGQQMALLLTLEGGAETERRLHARFAQYRTEGEWFWPHPDLNNWVREQVANV